jgi:pimeloyl-ACP methyl ester carboxylesterase
MESFGADIAAVVNKLNPEKAILIGHSMGGGVNLEAAKLLPEKVIGLIGVDTYKRFGTGYPEEVIDEYVTYFQNDFLTSMDEFVRNFFPENADTLLVNWVVTDMSAATQEVAISAMANFFKSNQQEILKEVRIPIWAINSDMWSTDTITNNQHANFYGLKLMTGVGHFVMLEDPVTFNQLLHETLDELTED